MAIKAKSNFCSIFNKRKVPELQICKRKEEIWGEIGNETRVTKTSISESPKYI